MLQDSRALTPMIKVGTPSTRRSRAKRCLVWEEIELQSEGVYSDSFHELSLRFPTLSLMELRISALIKGMLQSKEIANRLSITEETVQNHRSHIRKKLGLNFKENLLTHLFSKQ